MAADFQCPLELVDPEGDLVLEVGDLAADSTAEETSVKEEQDQDEERDEDDISDGSDRPVESEKQDQQAWVPQWQETGTINPKRSYVRILVCSKVLFWTSAVFRQMLSGSFKEAHQVPDGQGRRKLRLPEDDASSMLELRKILHYKPSFRDHNDGYPYELLESLAVLCDKYGFEQALHDFFEFELKFWLETTTKATLSGFQDLPGCQALSILKIALLAKQICTFRNATLVCAYLLDPDSLPVRLSEEFINVPIPDTFIRMSNPIDPDYAN